MSSHSKPTDPAFGAANLSNCEREQIHLAGCIQPHGALLSVREADQEILQASSNAASFFGITRSPVGLFLRDLGGDLWRCAAQLPKNPDVIPYVVRCRLGDPARLLNVLLHRAVGGEVVAEFENVGPPLDLSAQIEAALQAITDANTLQALCDASAGIFRDVAHYDRVMIYRFDEEGHGEVFSETRKPELEPFLGNRYPASDIPQIARRLYVRNRVRLLADVNYAPSAVEPRISPLTGEELDMSLCFLRSASPIHVQYLKNMGVSATLVVSLMVGDKLWGLVSCHHYSPYCLHFEMRAACELLGEAIGTRIAALESFARGQSDLAARRLEQRMAENISRDGDWRGALFDGSRSLLLPLGATGAALIYEGTIQTIGETPGTDQIRALSEWLETRFVDRFYATGALASVVPEFSAIVGVAAGVAAAQVSGDPTEMLIWFRQERVRTITWGGKPFKSPSDDDDPSELSPRRSFAQWHQVVEGTSDPWTPTDVATAKKIASAVTEVILHYRAVQIILAKDQLEQVSRRVREAEHLALVADWTGKILVGNSVLERLIGAPVGAVRHLGDLPQYFFESEAFELRLKTLFDERRSWRIDLAVKAGSRPDLHLQACAEAVSLLDDRLLGFVLMFVDRTKRRRAESARRSFQARIVTSHRRLSAKLETNADLKLQNLISQMVENAHLAALEVTDAADPVDMPALLDGIRRSLERSAEVLERLSFANIDVQAMRDRDGET